MIVRPIIMSPRMVLALLKGMKFQTRRLAFGLRRMRDDFGRPILMPSPTIWTRAAIGDLLWVRETWCVSEKYDATKPRDLAPGAMTVIFAAGGSIANQDTIGPEWAGDWRPSLFMPRWVSRLTLEVVKVRLQPLHAISNYDARMEGVDCWPDYVEGARDPFPVERYKGLWTTLHGAESWDANPDVVALTFRVHQQNIDDFINQRRAA